MKLEFRFSISPTPSFYSTIRLAALSLRRLGPPYDSARLHVSVGDCAGLDAIYAANPWSMAFPVDWRVVSHDLFRKYSYLATHNNRYYEPSNADVVVMCDSDVCVVNRIDDLVAYLVRNGHRTVAGVPAHFTPFHLDAAANEAAWQRVFTAAGLGDAPLSVRHSYDVAEVMGRTPPYFNYGFVLFGREAFAAIAPTNERYCSIAHAATKNDFFLTQIGLSLMIVAANLEVKLLPFAYNCPNEDMPFSAAEEFRLQGVGDIRVIHYLRDEQMQRRTFLVDPAAYEAFMTTPDLNRVNARLRDHLRALARHDDVLFR